jgi:uncharacterized iron-regulated membrane protein
MKISRLVLSTHQGFGLFIGIQVVLWISGGFVMSVLPIEKVRGEDWSAPAAEQTLPTDIDLLPPDRVARDLGLPDLEGANLAMWLERPVYRLQAAGTEHLTDAITGRLLSPLDAEIATRVALADYAGPGSVGQVHLQEEPLLEIRGRELPLWRVDFEDSRHTTIYVSPRTGLVEGRRNRIWRVYDFFWMLHIMDYGQRDDFNHPLLVGAAVAAWLLAVSGIWLVVQWLGRKRKRRRAA